MKKKVEQYEICISKPIAKGFESTVYIAKDTNTEKEYAVKIIPAKSSFGNKEVFNIFKTDLEILKQIKGEYVNEVKDFKMTPNNFYIFMDLCKDGTLENLIKKKTIFSELETLVLIHQLAKCFKTIDELNITTKENQKANITHRNLNPSKILLHNGSIKISKFGWANVTDKIDELQMNVLEILPVPFYIAPQIIAGDYYTDKCDVWSAGVIVYQMMFGVLPWDGNSVHILYSNIKSVPLTLPKAISKDLEDLLKRMLTFKDEERISWKDVLEHPVLKDIGFLNYTEIKLFDTEKKEESGKCCS